MAPLLCFDPDTPSSTVPHYQGAYSAGDGRGAGRSSGRQCQCHAQGAGEDVQGDKDAGAARRVIVYRRRLVAMDLPRQEAHAAAEHRCGTAAAFCCWVLMKAGMK